MGMKPITVHIEELVLDDVHADADQFRESLERELSQLVMTNGTHGLSTRDDVSERLPAQVASRVYREIKEQS